MKRCHAPFSFHPVKSTIKNEKPRKRDFPLGLSKGIDMNKLVSCAKEGMLHMTRNHDRANITAKK